MNSQLLFPLAAKPDSVDLFRSCSKPLSTCYGVASFPWDSAPRNYALYESLCKLCCCYWVPPTLSAARVE
uniref:Uncharacterized protein n=1 Tax=Picea glauca TaxID=3330 RepID=A0A101LY61_PICGL|nr:hypothetical protein ABT39_MTgene5685 [Picea glauca]